MIGFHFLMHVGWWMIRIGNMWWLWQNNTHYHMFHHTHWPSCLLGIGSSTCLLLWGFPLSVEHLRYGSINRPSLLKCIFLSLDALRVTLFTLRRQPYRDHLSEIVPAQPVSHEPISRDSCKAASWGSGTRGDGRAEERGAISWHDDRLRG